MAAASISDDIDNAAPTPRKRGRKRKYPLQTVRERMLEVSVAKLLETGISARLDAVRIDHMLVAAEVPRGSAYEAWAHDDRSPQENLQHAVMLHILEATTGNNADPTKELTLQIIEELSDLINSDDVADRQAARREITRRAAQFNHERLNSTMWMLYRSLALMVTAQPDPDPELLAAVQNGEEKLVRLYTDLFAEFAAVMRMSLKPGTSFEQLAISMIAVNDGLANHATPAFDQHQAMVIDATDWTVYAFCCEALYEAFFDFA